jgi:hypothetical protein
MRRNIMSHHRPCTYQGELPDSDAATDDRSRTYRSPIGNDRGGNLPVIGGFQLPLQSDGSGKQIIGEADVGTDKDAVLQGNTLKD